VAIFREPPTDSSSVPEVSGHTTNCSIEFNNETLFADGAYLYYWAYRSQPFIVS
jgi:hypothetical protein